MRTGRPEFAALLLAALAASAGVAPVLAAEAPTAEALAARVANVERLIEQSSGSRQIESGANASAHARRDEARTMLERAKSALAKNDRAAAAALLRDAARAMLEAVRMAGKPASSDDKTEREYAARAESIAVLIDALERIGVEKGAKSNTAATASAIRKKVEEAEATRRSGSIAEARKTLDAAYADAKNAIEALRGGETLVRTLSFESKEEEYRYELDRNDTHRMLVDVLAREKRANPAVDRMVTQYLERSSALRGDAEQQATSGDHAQAVETLERSTKELIRAIRSTGVYIPG